MLFQSATVQLQVGCLRRSAGFDQRLSGRFYDFLQMIRLKTGGNQIVQHVVGAAAGAGMGVGAGDHQPGFVKLVAHLPAQCRHHPFPHGMGNVTQVQAAEPQCLALPVFHVQGSCVQRAFLPQRCVVRFAVTMHGQALGWDVDQAHAAADEIGGLVLHWFSCG